MANEYLHEHVTGKMCIDSIDEYIKMVNENISNVSVENYESLVSSIENVINVYNETMKKLEDIDAECAKAKKELGYE